MKIEGIKMKDKFKIVIKTDKMKKYIHEYMKYEMINNNHFSIIGLLKNHIHKTKGISLEEYLSKQNKIRKCNFCNNFSKIVGFSFDSFKSGTLFISNIKYKKNFYYCYSKDCPGKKLNPNSVEFVSKSRNISNEEALKYIHRRNKSPFYRENHNSLKEYKSYQRRDEKWFIENNKSFDKFKKRLRYINTLDYFIEKLGSKELGLAKYLEINKRKDSMSFNHYLKKYNNNYIVARKEYNKRIKKCCSNLSPFICNGVSKESIKVLLKYYKFFRRQNIDKDKIFIGLKGSSEYNILYKTKEGNKRFFYDFTIPEIKLIIEYHGEKFHPNPKWRFENINKWNKWRGIFDNLNVEKRYKLDLLKKKEAEKSGFKVFEIYSSDNKEEKYEEIINWWYLKENKNE